MLCVTPNARTRFPFLVFTLSTHQRRNSRFGTVSNRVKGNTATFSTVGAVTMQCDNHTKISACFVVHKVVYTLNGVKALTQVSALPSSSRDRPLLAMILCSISRARCVCMLVHMHVCVHGDSPLMRKPWQDSWRPLLCFLLATRTHLLSSFSIYKGAHSTNIHTLTNSLHECRMPESDHWFLTLRRKSFIQPHTTLMSSTFLRLGVPLAFNRRSLSSLMALSELCSAPI